MTDVYVKGGAELDKLLQTLPVKLEKNIMRSALAAGARVIQREAKLNAPVGQPSNVGTQLYGGYPGALRDSVRVTTRFNKEGQATASVKAGGRTKKGAEVFYAHIVEFGARRHIIRPRVQREKGKRQVLKLGGVFVAGAVDHPGARPQPFMRPALDSRLTQAVEAVTTQVRKRLQKEGVDVPAPIGADE